VLRYDSEVMAASHRRVPHHSSSCCCYLGLGARSKNRELLFGVYFGQPLRPQGGLLLLSIKQASRRGRVRLLNAGRMGTVTKK
jgi:hypothetical protein